ncbi:putative glycoside hydrolase family 18 protein [Eutypa lata UCREL1]|uniref:chitinase n=1 Tax=Eutypa lata (strain UCR-EL1) TaxID=1287681 RepID=M7T9F1_EUTLA|nr:putative glycoside hydrolase family 18 protein [Eutypa lata UCREL1]
MYSKISLVLAGLSAVSASASSQKDYKLNTYWGQNGVGDTLAQYCASDSIDYVTLGFVTQSPEHGNGYPGTNFAAHCASGVYYNNGQETQLLKDCDFIKADIKTCQSLGKKILLSIGGVWSEVNDYSLSSTTAGGDFADFLFDAFGPYQEGYDGPRPFDPTGDHTSIDGFDFDIEVKFPDQLPYVAMVERLRERIEAVSKDMIVTAAPQCPTSADWFQMSTIITQAKFDKIWIQFYNNEGCDATSDTTFNFGEWELLLSVTPNHDTELFIGLPGGEDAASSGYIDRERATDVICSAKEYDQFAGVMLWDAYFAAENKVGGKTYYDSIAEILECGCAGELQQQQQQQRVHNWLQHCIFDLVDDCWFQHILCRDLLQRFPDRERQHHIIEPSSSTASSTSTEDDCTDESTSSTGYITSSSSASVTASPTISITSATRITSATATSSSTTASTEDECEDETTTSSSASATSTSTTSSSSAVEISSYSATAAPSSSVTGASSSSASTTAYTTSTVMNTVTYTITSCAPTVTNCPVGSVTTETIAISTTVCPVTATSQQPTTEVPVTTSTIYSTRVATVTKCPASVTNCPVGSVTTETIAISTTVCPVTETSTKATNVPGINTYINTPAQPTEVSTPSTTTSQPFIAETITPSSGSETETTEVPAIPTSMYPTFSPSPSTIVTVPLYPTGGANNGTTVIGTATGIVVPVPVPTTTTQGASTTTAATTGCSGAGCPAATTSTVATAGAAKNAAFSLGGLFFVAGVLAL